MNNKTEGFAPGTCFINHSDVYVKFGSVNNKSGEMMPAGTLWVVLTDYINHFNRTVACIDGRRAYMGTDFLRIHFDVLND